MLLSTGPFNFLAIRIDMADADCQSSNGRTRPNPGRLSGTERQTGERRRRYGCACSHARVTTPIRIRWGWSPTGTWATCLRLL